MDNKGIFVAARVLEREAKLRETLRRVGLLGGRTLGDPKRPPRERDSPDPDSPPSGG